MSKNFRLNQSAISISLMIVFVTISFFAFNSYGKKISELEDYSSVNSYLETGAMILHDNLSAEDYALSYVPKSGWVFIIKNYGQFGFERVSSAIKGSLESVELLVLQDKLKPSAKLTISLKLDLAEDYLITFQAKDLEDTSKWAVYQGSNK